MRFMGGEEEPEFNSALTQAVRGVSVKMLPVIKGTAIDATDAATRGRRVLPQFATKIGIDPMSTRTK